MRWRASAATRPRAGWSDIPIMTAGSKASTIVVPSSSDRTTTLQGSTAAIEGSTYCGLPQHQALSRFETSQMAVLGAVSETEVEILADPDADQGQVDEIVARAESEFVEEAPAEASEESAAGPVAAEDSSSSQAAGEEPTEQEPVVAEEAEQA